MGVDLYTFVWALAPPPPNTGSTPSSNDALGPSNPATSQILRTQAVYSVEELYKRSQKRSIRAFKYSAINIGRGKISKGSYQLRRYMHLNF